MSIEKRYEWRELSDDGLLCKPPEFGPYYDRESINCFGGFSSEEEAIVAYMDFVKKHKYGAPSKLVLVTFYVTSDVND